MTHCLNLLRSPCAYRAARQRGVTLLEAFVVLSILAFVATLALPLFIATPENRLMEGVANELATDLRYVRSASVARNGGVRISFETTSFGSCYVIHTGDAGACRCEADTPAAICGFGAKELKTVLLPASKQVRVQSNVASMLFDPRSGTTSPSGTVKVIGPQGAMIQHVVSLMGRVRSCAHPEPALAVAKGPLYGYRVC
jgi:type IV fimbrial biogenesis protein FimT